MKNLRKILKAYYVKEAMVCWLVFYMCFGMPAQIVMAVQNPAPGALPNGIIDQLGVDNPVINNSDMTINQTANEAIINWNNFDIGSDASVTFLQPGTSSAVLNRVHDGEITGIMGDLTANGGVFIINPAGILISSSDSVNVNQLVASSLDIDDADFLNGASYTFANGVVEGVPGDVINEGSINAERIALIGRNVINRGILMAGKSVVMAAGDTVILSETGGKVSVEFEVGDDWVADDYKVYQVRNEDGEVRADGSTAQIVMAAGDVWAAALVEAYSEADSPAVASVVIDAEGDVTVTDEINAEAHGDGISNATATITVNAGGTVKVYSDSDENDSDIDADAEGGKTNTAEITINAGDKVKVKAEDGGNSEIEAYAHNGTTNIATIDITIGEEGDSVEVTGDGWDSDAEIEAKAYEGDTNIAEVTVKAEDDVKVRAYNNGEADLRAEATNDIESNTATVKIITGHNVEVTADGWDSRAGIEAEAYDGDTNKAKVDIDVENDVKVRAYNGGEVDIDAETYDGENNTATMIINADDDVLVKAEGCDSDADIDSEAYEAENSNTATLTVNAGDNIEVKATNGGNADIDSEAMGSEKNTATIDITAVGDVEVIAKGTCEGCDDDDRSDAEITAKAENIDEFDIYLYDGDVLSVSNKASIDITSRSVEVRGENGGSATIESIARNEISFGGGEVDVIEVTLKDITNDADIVITTIADEEEEGGTASVKLFSDGDGAGNGDVLVKAKNGGHADVDTEAFNDIYYDYDTPLNLTIDGPIENTSNITVNAAGDVKVIADGRGKCGDCGGSDAEMDAEAWNWLYDDYGYISLVENGAITNIAGVDIIAGDDVMVKAEDGWAYVGSCAENWSNVFPDVIPDTKTNTATVAIDAAGNVMVIGCDGEALIEAWASFAAQNTAQVTVDAGGHVVVLAMGNEVPCEEDGAKAGIEAYAEDASNSNTASVDIKANNVLAAAGDGADARIKARAAYTYSFEKPSIDQINGDIPEADGTTNTASVNIEAFKVEIEEPAEEPSEPDGPSLASALPSGGIEEILADYIDGGHVAAIGYNGGDAQIEAVTFGGRGSDPVNTSDVLICAEGIVVAGALDCQERDTNAEISALAHFGFENNASLGIGAGQGVASLALGENAKSSINSVAMYGYTNTADLVACTSGPVAVLAMNGGEAAIESGAHNGHINEASTAVCADSLVIVGAAYGGDAIITSEAGVMENGNGLAQVAAVNGEYDPSSATAETIVISQGSGVVVAAMEEGYADISSIAVNADNTDAYTGVCAQDHVIVAAGTEDYVCDYFGGYFGDGDLIRSVDKNGSGGEAYIFSEAGSGYDSLVFAPSVDIVQQQPDDYEYDPPTANAETAVVSHEGSVLVADATNWDQGGNAAIESEAYGSGINTAYTGVAAGADLAPILPVDEPDLEPMISQVVEEESVNIIEYLEEMYRDSLDPGNVYVEAEGPYSNAKIHSFAHGGNENTADTVVCAPGEVSVYGEGHRSNAKIKACAEDGDITTATTQVYASEVSVEVEGLYRGNGIGTWTDSDGWVHVENGFYFLTGDSDYPPVSEQGDATLIIDSYAKKQDCPDCPPCPGCPCEDDLLAPVAPLAQFEIPRIEGCPALMLAAAAELGIPAETLQVAIGNSQATNPSIQPCQACSTLVSAANILKNEGDMRMAALAQAFNTLAPADAPYTPEVAASVAMALATAEEGSQFASAAEYIDALVQYVAVLDTDLGSPVGDSVAFVMEKHGAGLTASDNVNMVAFVTARIESLATFSQ